MSLAEFARGRYARTWSRLLKNLFARFPEAAAIYSRMRWCGGASFFRPQAATCLSAAEHTALMSSSGPGVEAARARVTADEQLRVDGERTFGGHEGAPSPGDGRVALQNLLARLRTAAGSGGGEGDAG